MALLHRITTRVLFPTLAAFPSALFAASDLPAPWPKPLFDALKEFEAAHPSVRTWVVFLPLFLIPAAFVFDLWRESIEKREKLVEKELALLLRCLEKPVGRKRVKFAELLVALGKNTAPADLGEVLSIADPSEQIRSLIEGIHYAFSQDVTRPDELKVTLARMNGEFIQSFECFLPSKSGPRVQTASLQTPDCTFSVAAKQRRPIIIPDLQQELSQTKKKKKGRRYVEGNAGGVTQGSLICYPVVIPELDMVPFVIGVKYSEPNHFTTASERRYEFILSQFAERISLEFCLRKLAEIKNHP